MYDSKLAERICKRQVRLSGLRGPHENRWRDGFNYSFTERADAFYGSSNMVNNDQHKKPKIVDSTGLDACKTLSAGIVGAIVPSNMQWFDLTSGDDDQIEHNDWLSESGRFIWENIHASNFDSTVNDNFHDAVVAGWFVLYCEEAEGGGFNFEWWPIGECFVSASKSGGMIDTIYREMTKSVEQCVNEYGLENVSKQTRELYMKGPDQWDKTVELLYCIEPRQQNNPDSPFAKDLPFAAYHVEKANKHICRESGYHEFPCAVPRVRIIPKSHYAIGPYDDALANVKTLQSLGKDEIQASELAVGGIWKAKDDGVLNPSTVRIGPRRVVIVADMANFERMDTSNGRGAQQGWSTKQDLQQQIRKQMRTDQLEPQDKPQMTAYEVSVRVAMIRTLIGPEFNRFENEFLGVIVKRCFAISMRAGVLGDPPEGLEAYSVDYTSPLARAQKQEDAEATKMFVGYVNEQAQVTGDTSVLDIINKDKANRHVADGTNVPTDILNSPDEIAEIRKTRERQAQEQAKQEEQQQMQVMAAEGAAKRAGAMAL